MIKKISNSVWKFTGTDKVNMYFLDLNEKIIIDCGNRSDRNLVKQFLGKIIDFSEVNKVIFTHLHYDHTGNFDLFGNADFFASEEEIKDFLDNKIDFSLDKEFAEKLKAKLKPLPEKINVLEIIKTPGHTRGSVCIWFEKGGVLFTGDTIFKQGFGRTDLSTSVPGEIRNSINKLVKYNYDVLAPGHDY